MTKSDSVKQYLATLDESLSPKEVGLALTNSGGVPAALKKYFSLFVTPDNVDTCLLISLPLKGKSVTQLNTDYFARIKKLKTIAAKPIKGWSEVEMNLLARALDSIQSFDDYYRIIKAETDESSNEQEVDDSADEQESTTGKKTDKYELTDDIAKLSSELQREYAFTHMAVSLSEISGRYFGNGSRPPTNTLAFLKINTINEVPSVYLANGLFDLKVKDQTAAGKILCAPIYFHDDFGNVQVTNLFSEFMSDSAGLLDALNDIPGRLPSVLLNFFSEDGLHQAILKGQTRVENMGNYLTTLKSTGMSFYSGDSVLSANINPVDSLETIALTEYVRQALNDFPAQLRTPHDKLNSGEALFFIPDAARVVLLSASESFKFSLPALNKSEHDEIYVQDKGFLTDVKALASEIKKLPKVDDRREFLPVLNEIKTIKNEVFPKAKFFTLCNVNGVKKHFGSQNQNNSTSLVYRETLDIKTTLQSPAKNTQSLKGLVKGFSYPECKKSLLEKGYSGAAQDFVKTVIREKVQAKQIRVRSGYLVVIGDSELEFKEFEQELLKSFKEYVSSFKIPGYEFYSAEKDRLITRSIAEVFREELADAIGIK